jgi:hypothetical protein
VGEGMSSSPKEVIYRHVFKDSTYQIANADPIGFYFDGGDTFFSYPHKVITHFMPCYGPAHTNRRTAEWIRKIDCYNVMSATEILSSGNGDMISLFEQQLEVFPGDRTKNRIHVFRLAEKIALPIQGQNFEGGAYGYFDLSEVLYG